MRIAVMELASGDEVAVRSHGAEANYALGDHQGVAVFTFDVDRPGDYDVVADGVGFTFGQIAIGRGIFTGLFATIGGGIVVGMVAVLAAAVIAIVTGIRRNDDRRRRQWGPTGRPPPAGDGPSPAGYGPPPGSGPPAS